MTMRQHLLALTVLCLCALGVQAQEPEIGSLLIASGSLSDPNYERTVLLIVHNGEDGALAVALNRPTWIEPREAFPDVDPLENYTGRVFFGGPIAPSQPLIVFERGRRLPQNSQPIIGSIYVSADLEQLENLDLAGETSPRVRLFAGHSAWVPGQLAREIAAGNWRVVPAVPNQIFADDPATLWETLPLAGDAVTASLRY
jgi:putative transcriptional regulator